MNVDDYLRNLRYELLKPENWQKVIMTREWTSVIPDLPGVYVLKHLDKIVYVGETGSLKGRMNDLLDTRNHTVRRTIGKVFFSTVDGFKQGTGKVKFPDHIEILVNEHICSNLSLAYLMVPLGRKELEELIEGDIDLDVKLNKRGKRKKSSLELNSSR